MNGKREIDAKFCLKCAAMLFFTVFLTSFCVNAVSVEDVFAGTESCLGHDDIELECV